MKREEWERRGVGLSHVSKCNLCWCIVGATGGMPEVPVTMKMGDLEPNQPRVGAGWDPG